MKRKQFIGTLLKASASVLCWTGIQASQTFKKISADNLITDIARYRKNRVEIEGLIIHVCGVDGKKMKLQTEKGEIIKISPHHSLGSFNESFYKKRVTVSGIADETRIDEPYIDRMAKAGSLLCHIDHTPCKDSLWVKRQIESGAAAKLSKRAIEKLRNKMKQTGTNYVSLVTIIAEKVTINEEIIK